LEKIEDIVKSFLDLAGVKVETTSIYKELFPGETTTVRVKLRNSLSSSSTISLSAEGDVKDFIFFETTQIELGPNEIRDVLIKIVSPQFIDPGTYDGDLVLTSDKEHNSNLLPWQINENINHNIFKFGDIEDFKEKIKGVRLVSFVHTSNLDGASNPVSEMINIAHENDVLVMLDAAQSVGSTYKKSPIGSRGDLVTFSFHETKNINCGEGGALCVNNEDLIDRAYFVQEKGTDPPRGTFQEHQKLNETKH